MIKSQEIKIVHEHGFAGVVKQIYAVLELQATVTASCHEPIQMQIAESQAKDAILRRVYGEIAQASRDILRLYNFESRQPNPEITKRLDQIMLICEGKLDSIGLSEKREGI